MKNNKLLYTNLFPEDENGREINIYKMSDVIPIGDNLLYRNLSFINRYGTTINPIDEKIILDNSYLRKIGFLQDV